MSPLSVTAVTLKLSISHTYFGLICIVNDVSFVVWFAVVPVPVFVTVRI